MIETIETGDGFFRLADDWRQLAATHPNPLLQYEWFEACAHAFCPPDRFHVIVVRRDGTVGDVKVTRGLRGGLNDRAIQAVKQWKFSPGRMKGVPVEVVVEVGVEFRLR